MKIQPDIYIGIMENAEYTSFQQKTHVYAITKLLIVETNLKNQEFDGKQNKCAFISYGMILIL